MGKGNDPHCDSAPMSLGLHDIRAQVAAAASRVAQLGNWPSYIDVQQSLTGRVPTPDAVTPAPGFDAGIACCLDLIPRHRQRLAATLHAAYTPEAVRQVIREAQHLHPDSETTWWLAACSICQEGTITPAQFAAQLDRFDALVQDPAARRAAALSEIRRMRSLYEIRDGVAYGTQDGCQQGAYLDGHQVAVMYAAQHDLYFVGTYQPTLGLENFPFSDERDDHDRPRSGPVHGSRQFVKACSPAELQRALAHVRNTTDLLSR